MTVSLLLMVGCSSASNAAPADVAVPLATLEGEYAGVFTGGFRGDLGWSAEDVYVSPDGQCAAVALAMEESQDGIIMVLASQEHYSVLDIYGDQYPDHPDTLDRIENLVGNRGWIPTDGGWVGVMFDDVNVSAYREGVITFGPKCQEELHGSLGTSTSTTTPTTTNQATTTTTQARITTPEVENPAVLAAYLADLGDLQATLVEGQADLAVASDPAAGADLFESFVAALEEIDPPDEVQAHYDRSLELFRQMATAQRSFADVAAIGDTDDTQRAAIDLLEIVGALGPEIAELDANQALLTISVFATRPDDPEAVYLVELLSLQREAAPVVEDLFAALSFAGTDPLAALEQMAEALDRFDAVVDEWEALEPSVRYEDLHRRALASFEALSKNIGEILDAARNNENLPFGVLLEMQTFAVESQRLNADRSRAVADSLRAIAG